MEFNEPYKVYLDISAESTWAWDEDDKATWEEISCHISPFSEELEDDEYFRRAKWGEVQFRNEPYLGSSLFCTINGLSTSQDIRIKVVFKEGTIRGYFGKNDMKPNNDKKISSVTPAILDQYTAILENNDESVELFDNIGVYHAEWTGIEDTFTENHIIQLDIDEGETNCDDARTQGADYSVENGGSFLSQTRKAYDINYTYNLKASYVVGFYVALVTYDKYGNQVSIDTIVAKYTTDNDTKNLIGKYTGTISIEKEQYLQLFCGVTHRTVGSVEIGRITYEASTFEIDLQSGLDETQTVTINTTSLNLKEVEAWTQTAKGRGDSTDSDLTRFFDDDTEYLNAPLTDLFDATDIDCNQTLYFNNGLDVNEEITSLKLGDLVDALGDKYYDLSEVVIYRGRSWKPAFHSRRYRLYVTCKFSRQEVYLYETDDEGDPIEPEGEGWEETSIRDIYGRVLWVRKPYNSSIKTWTLTPFGADDETNTMEDGTEYHNGIKSVIDYPSSSENKNEYTTALTLRDVIKTVYNGSSTLLADKEVRSTFFWNDDEDLIGYYNDSNSGVNYVTGGNNELNNILCLHTTDLDTTSSAEELEMTFGDLMEDLKMLFYNNIFWWIDEKGTLRIEHIKYFDFVTAVRDESDNVLLDEIDSHDYDKSENYEKVTIDMNNASYADFTNNEIINNHIASNERGDNDADQDESIDSITTDIKHCIENATDIDNGLLLLACDDSNVCMNTNVPIANRTFENGHLALSNILTTYCLYDGISETGKINGETVEYLGLKRNKQGDEISLKGILARSAGKGYLSLITPIGNGFIKSFSFDLSKRITTDIVLLYGKDTDEGDEDNNIVLVVSREIDDDGEIWYDFDNYEKTEWIDIQTPVAET